MNMQIYVKDIVNSIKWIKEVSQTFTEEKNIESWAKLRIESIILLVLEANEDTNHHWENIEIAEEVTKIILNNNFRETVIKNILNELRYNHYPEMGNTLQNLRGKEVNKND